ncbi:MAG: SprT-like domain-containing protein [Candidatus Acidiferrales bacterium]
MTKRRERAPVPGGDAIFQRIFTRIGCKGRPPQFLVEYHPYAGLTLTIRLRHDVAQVRLSDALQDAPPMVIEAAAAILLGRLYRRRAPRELVEAYRAFSYSHAVRERVHSLRQKRGRRASHRPSGAHHDLDAMFNELNGRYFEAALPKPTLSWSSRAWRSQLGCFDPALQQIVINRQLDRPNVPRFVVAYVMYHEMLHVKHPMKFARCRRESHGPEFRREEKKYAEYGAAMKFLDRMPAR